jgi:hypothetical protein
MNPPKGSKERADLRQSWRRWTAVVELFARRSRARFGVDPKEYEALHTGLMASCRGLAGVEAEAGKSFYGGLERLARPWLNAGALEQADREIVLDLYLRCREAGRRLGCWTWAHALRRRAGALIALAMAAAAAALLAVFGGPLWPPLMRWLGDSWRTIRLAVLQTGVNPWWLVGGVVVGLMFLIFLAGRRTGA